MSYSEEENNKCLKHCTFSGETYKDKHDTIYEIYTCSIPNEGFTKNELANFEYNEVGSLYFMTADHHSTNKCISGFCPEALSMEGTEYPFKYEDIFNLMELNNYDNYNFELSSYKNSPNYRKDLFNNLANDVIIAPTEITIDSVQLTRDWANEYIQTNMNRAFTETGSYLIGSKQEEPVGNLEEITTTQAGNIVFESSESFDSNYHLGVDDITESITDTDASKVEAKTDKTLIKLYDINMLDKDNKVVDMGNGTYTIKVALSDLLKKYNEYQVVYINENSVELIPTSVEENYIVFNTTHLSKYGIVGIEKTTKKDIITGEEITNPKTADAIVTLILLFISLAFASALVLYRIKKIKRLD